MAVITEIIPEQSFETIKQRIGAILLDEITNQIALNSSLSDDFNVDFEVFIDRTTNIDSHSNLVINVSLGSASYDNYTPFYSEGEVTYYVDVYASFSDDGKSGSRTMANLSRFVGLIRYILSSVKYNTLGDTNGLIGGRYIQSIQFEEPQNNQDKSDVKMARIYFIVRMKESQQGYASLDFGGNDTIIKLSDTEKGYKLIFNND